LPTDDAIEACAAGNCVTKNEPGFPITFHNPSMLFGGYLA